MSINKALEIGAPIVMHDWYLCKDIYGRFYGKDGEQLRLVTPGGTIFKENKESFRPCTFDDLTILKQYEGAASNPYSPFLTKNDEKYEIIPDPVFIDQIIDSKNNYWLRYQGYFDVDEDVFGNALCTLLSIKLGVEYYFQKIHVTCQENNNPNNNYYRGLLLISPNIYKDGVIKYKSDKVFLKKRESDSIFKLAPLKLPTEDFVLYFGESTKNRKIILGKYNEAGQFEPNNYNFIQDIQYSHEVLHDNPSYDFVGDFIELAFHYQLLKRGENLTDEDMDNILALLGVDKTDEVSKIKEKRKNAHTGIKETSSL